MQDFTIEVEGELTYISWKKLEKVMGKRMYKQFLKFINGQTCVQQGAYPWDIKNFLRHPSKRFFD